MFDNTVKKYTQKDIASYITLSLALGIGIGVIVATRIYRK